MIDFEVPEVDYTDYTNRQLAGPPLAVLLVALLVLGGGYALTGTPVDLGMDFTGGSEMRFTADDDLQEIQSTFEGEIEVEAVRPLSEANTYLLQTPETDTQRIASVAEEAGYQEERTNTRDPSFGGAAQQQALLGVGIAFVGMSVLVFLLFRTFIPSIAVVLSAFSDLMIPLALMSLFGIDLTLGTVAALLMIIGYSVDSDILLNNHILRRRGGFYDSTYRAMRTGVTMTITSIAAMIGMFVIATMLDIPLLPDIALILVFGLTADLMNTYMLNLSLLRYYKYEAVKS